MHEESLYQLKRVLMLCEFFRRLVATGWGPDRKDYAPPAKDMNALVRSYGVRKKDVSEQRRDKGCCENRSTTVMMLENIQRRKQTNVTLKHTLLRPVTH